MKYHMLALSLGLLLDFLVGDPYWMPHPIRWIGRLIGRMDQRLLGTEEELAKKERNEQEEGSLGICLVLIVLLVTGIISLFLLCLAYQVNVWAGVALEAILTAYCLATKSLKTESMKVYRELEAGNLEGARKAVSMIVGRDTESLDAEGVAKAAVETVAENTSDGVIAPLFYLVIGGPVLGLIYKAVNTMDSMVGYHNDRYENFGRAAARVDDCANYIPSRISAMYLIGAAWILGKEYDPRGAVNIFERDRYNHKSPNSAQTESVVAGALGLELAGNASYFGKIVEKPTIGDALRRIVNRDILRVNRMMYTASILAYVDGMILLFLVGWLMNL